MIKPLKPGDDSRYNWKTINQCIDEQQALWNKNAADALAIAEIRRRHLDVSGSLQTYRVKSKAGDVLTCRTWDGTTEGDTDVLVAVNRNSRQLDSETINSITYTYTAYTALADGINETRNSDDGSTEETQLVTPMWYVNCEIDVLATTYSGVQDDDLNDLKLIEVSARCWAKIADPA